MNTAIKALLTARLGRWVAIQCHAVVFIGKLVALQDDGVVIQATNGRMVAIPAGVMTLAADTENEAALEEEAERVRAELIAARH